MTLTPEQFDHIDNLSNLELEQYLREDTDREQLVEYFGGEEEYESLRRIISEPLKTRSQPGSTFAGAEANLILLPGIMGSELVDKIWGKVWINLLKLLVQPKAFTALTLDENGEREKDEKVCFEPTDIYSRFYFKTQLWLEKQGYKVYPFAYDWRKSIDISAQRLHDFVEEKVKDQPDTRFVFVAHSMGGLVVRRYLQLFKDKGAEKRLRKLIMLGTPNHGSYLPMATMVGMGKPMMRIAGYHFGDEVFQGVVQSFLGLFELLPSPHLERLSAEVVYKELFWGKTLLSKTLLAKARELHDNLQSPLPKEMVEKMVLIANNELETWKSVDRREKKDGQVIFQFGYGLGDDTVPFDSAYLEGVTTYITSANHGSIQKDEAVLKSIKAIIDGKPITSLPSYTKKLGRKNSPSEFTRFVEIDPNRKDDLEKLNEFVVQL